MMLYVKNMVCHRCVMAVQEILTRHSIPYTSIRLGEVEIPGVLTVKEEEALNIDLKSIGFDRIDDRKSRTIERIKTGIIGFVRQEDDGNHHVLSDYLAEKLLLEYKHLSKLFSDIEGTTIEKYYIAQRIERVKELVVYDELTIKEIANRMGYSSPSYLSSQFKRVTGLTPSHFKKIGNKRRVPIDRV